MTAFSGRPVKRHPRAQVVYQRCRHIANRLGLIRRIYPPDSLDWFGRWQGRLSKWNLSCSCWVCRKPRYDRAREKAEQGRFLLMAEDLQSQFVWWDQPAGGTGSEHNSTA